MALCLAIGSNPKQKAVNILKLKVYTNVDCIAKSSISDGIELLSEMPNINVIVTDNFGDESDKIKTLSQFLVENSLKIPIIVLGDCPNEIKDLKNITVIEDHLNNRNIAVEVAKLLSIEMNSPTDDIKDELFPIPAYHFTFLKEAICDVYITEDETAQDPRYHQIVKADSSINFTKQKIKEFANNGVLHFYIPTEHRFEFVQAYSEQVLFELQDPDADPMQKAKATSVALDITSESILENGFTEETVKLSKESMKSLITFAKQHTDKKIMGLIANLIKQRTSYKFQLIQLSTILGVHALNELGWNSKEQQEKLGYVAFFHDLLLNTDEMLKISTEEELEASALSPKHKEVVKNHALWVLEILDKYPENHFGALTLVKQHHGAHSGIGFPESFPSNISLLSIVFIVAEAYAKAIIENYETKEYQDKELFDVIAKKFPTSQYRKVLKTFATLKF
ncbi:MAG: hypothetical protein ACPGJV_13370 [Bacteriovoracaceae bacterium]